MEKDSLKRFAHHFKDHSPSPTKRRATLKPRVEEDIYEHTEDELDSSNSPTLSWTSWSPLSEPDSDANADAESEDNVDIVKTTSFVFSEVCKYYPNVLREITTSNSGTASLNVRSWDLNSWKEEVEMMVETNLPNCITSSGSSYMDNALGRMFHECVDIDGVPFCPGDFVLTESPQFARIITIYQQEPKNDYMVHLQLFQHGSDIAVLKQLASPVELFFTRKCIDMPVNSFRGKVKVTHDSTSEDAAIIERKYELGEYFYRLSYDSAKQRFLDIPDMEGQVRGTECQLCTQSDKDQEKCTILGSDHKLLKSKIYLEGIRHRGIEYRVHDFVYIFEAPQQPFTIGQITKIYTKQRHWFSTARNKKELDFKRVKITVDIFERYDKLLNASWFYDGGKHAVRDERRLYRTRTEMKVIPDELEGKCWIRPRTDFGGIRELDAFKDNAHHFWVKDQVGEDLDPDSEIGRGALVPLTDLECSQQTKGEMEDKKSFLEQPGMKLRGLDIFSGAGGLSLGMQSSGLVDPDTLHAIEFDTAACKTHAINFPNCIMHNADASELLERAVRRERGEIFQPLVGEGKVIPELPRPGEVDIIFGGPPCQGFSSMNRYKKAEDPKNALIAMYLGYVELYRPKYFLLENVQGLMYNKLGAAKAVGEDGKIRLEGGIENGTVKLIFRILTGIGYQVQYGLLEAAEYDVASVRKRVIFWASLPEYPLPPFPQPKNVLVLPRNIGRIGKGIPSNWYRKHRSAPHKMITMGAAIADLPAFDWQDPKASVVALLRRDRSIRSYPVSMTSRFVGQDAQPYPSTRPLSEYQRRLRSISADERLRNHVTDRYKPDLVNQVCTVPIKKSDYSKDRKTYHQLEFDLLFSKSDNSEDKKTYRRLDFDLPFSTCLTTVRPDQKCGRTIHSTQHRVITIREISRAMSFPDSFVFPLNAIKADAAYKQIGNAVPPNFAQALAREAVIVRMEKYEREKGENSNTGRTFFAPKHENTGKTVDFIDLTSDDE